MNVKCRLANVHPQDGLSSQSAPVKYGHYLVDIYYRMPGAPDGTSLADTLLAMGYAEPYPLPACTAARP